jgi:hypothetical protein
MTPEQKIWIPVVLTLAVVLFLGWLTFTKVETGERPFGYGTVPFVPAKSHYSSARVPLPHVPTPAATVPPEKRGEGAR